MELSHLQNISAVLQVSSLFYILFLVWVIDQIGELSTYMPHKGGPWLGIEPCLTPLSVLGVQRWNEFSRFKNHES